MRDSIVTRIRNAGRTGLLLRVLSNPSGSSAWTKSTGPEKRGHCSASCRSAVSHRADAGRRPPKEPQAPLAVSKSCLRLRAALQGVATGAALAAVAAATAVEDVVTGIAPQAIWAALALQEIVAALT